MSVEQEILVTGIKVVDLLAPYAKGGKIGRWHLVETECAERGGPCPPQGWGAVPVQHLPSLMRNNLTFVLLSLLKQRLII